jgi:predicted nucleic acid binding AN1-type Zn finger protein
MAEDADLMGLGEHCSAPGCGQVDFLPFTCDCCSSTFCLEHRSYSAHSCEAAAGKATEVIVCPLCAKGVRLQAGQDPNAAFEQHQRSNGCDPSNYRKVHNKARCPVGRCQEKISLINTYTCKTCKLKVCLKHRLPDDHACGQHRGGCAEACMYGSPSLPSSRCRLSEGEIQLCFTTWGSVEEVGEESSRPAS